MIGIIAAIVYGILAIAGGIFGYTKARSKPSLISGLFSGTLLLLGALGLQLGADWGLPLAVCVTAVLIAVFTVRLAATGKFMPAGVMIVVGVLALVGLLGST